MTEESMTNSQNGTNKASQRARRVLNCAPCRKNKLKCDRKRPCSSCQLRGSVTMCQYEDEGWGGNGQWRFVGPQGETMETYEPESGSDSEPSRADNIQIEQSRISGVVAAQAAPQNVQLMEEVARVRQELENLERQLKSGKEGVSHPAVASLRAATQENSVSAASSPVAFDSPPAQAVPSPHGLYMGPTTDVFAIDQFAGSYPTSVPAGLPHKYLHIIDVHHHDPDLVAQLPAASLVEYLVDRYFEYCNWIYRFAHEPTVREAWQRFKTNKPTTRVELATICVVVAITIRYLPLDHDIFTTLRGNPIELGNTYFTVSCDLLERHREITPTHGTYTLELVELVLAQTHYLIFSERRRDEVWILCGELLSITTAMGLHRDPQNLYPADVAERRRWAWWNLMLVERWHAFSLGRPIRISPNHFNTKLPAHSLNAVGEERKFLPNIALFKLMNISAATSDEAMANVHITLEVLQEKDRLLTNWFDELPKEVFMPDAMLTRNLVSRSSHDRRIAVQGTILRGLYNYIRFTLHRPHILMPHSLDIAIASAADLISLMAQAHDSNTPGHFIWGPCQTFSVAMFFSLQLILNPNQARSALYQEQIRKATTLFKPDSCLPGIADGAITILRTLAPLYNNDLLANPTADAREEKNEIVRIVNNMTYPHRSLPDFDTLSPYEPMGSFEDEYSQPPFSQPGYAASVASSMTRSSSAASSVKSGNSLSIYTNGQYTDSTPMFADTNWQFPHGQQIYGGSTHPASDSGRSTHSPPALSPGASSSGASSPELGVHIPQYAMSPQVMPPDNVWSVEYQSQVKPDMFAPFYDIPDAPGPTLQAYSADANANANAIRVNNTLNHFQY